MRVFNYLKNKKIQKKFTDIFYNNSFVGSDSISGPGSDLTQTEVIRNEIPKLFEKYRIKSFIDAPCGDLYWMQHVKLEGISYIGIDIVKELIIINTKKFNNSTKKFACKNIITDKLPNADLVLIRDCWVHLNSKDVFSCINNLKRNSIRYLLTTSFTSLTSNRELINIWRPLNLELAPFNFPTPIIIMNENCTEEGGIYSDKSLLMWEISELPSYQRNL
jgi:hypothetical protein